MKRIFLILVLAFACVFANASNGKKVTTSQPQTQAATPNKAIEWQSNMMLSDTKTKPAADDECYYLGIYDVYVDGIYIGTYHVWLCFFEVQQ
jgi:hypothetical protein